MYLIGEAGPNDPHRQLLATKAGTPIPNTRRRPQPPKAMEDAAATMAKDYQACLRSAASDYNCVGMALASRRAFVDIEHLHWILRDDGYWQITESRVIPGDLVLYGKGGELTHVGVVISHDPDFANARFKTTVLSQMGQWGEYFHDLHAVAMTFGEPMGFWTERLPKD